MIEFVLSHDFVFDAALVDMFCILRRFDLVHVEIFYFEVIQVLAEFQLLWFLIW